MPIQFANLQLELAKLNFAIYIFANLQFATMACGEHGEW